MQFTPPTVRDGQSRYQGQQLSSGGFGCSADTVDGSGSSAASKADDEEVEEGGQNTGVILGVIIGAFAMGFMALFMWMMQAKNKQAEHWDENGEWHESHGQEMHGHGGGAPDMYASKVAALDNQWMHEQHHHDGYHEQHHHEQW
jgi:hypothetical protein